MYVKMYVFYIHTFYTYIIMRYKPFKLRLITIKLLHQTEIQTLQTFALYIHNNEIQTLQTEINNIEIIPGTGNVNKKIHFHTSHTDFRYQRNTTNNDNRRQFVIQNHYFTFQRQYNTNHLDLQIQMMQLQIEQMQAQINSMSSNNPPPDEPGIGTAWLL